MIRFEKKLAPKPLPKDPEENRFEQIRRTTAEKRKEYDADAARRGARQAAEDKKLI